MHCTCKAGIAEVCVVDTGETVGAVVVSSDTGALVVDTWVLVASYLEETQIDITDNDDDDDGVLTAGNAEVAVAAQVDTGGGVLAVISVVVEGVVEVMCSNEGAGLPSVVGDVHIGTSSVLFVVVTLAEVVVVVVQTDIPDVHGVLATVMVVTRGAT